jgi:two-component system response regulator PilR (NtrC family)
MKNGDSLGRMPEPETETKLAKILDSDILEKFGFGSSSLAPKSQKYFMEWTAAFLISKSPKMRSIYEIIEKISGVNVNVLITGETGTGKESVARVIHYNSPRKEKAFVTINCAAIPEPLLDSELFGHVKGAYTGAVKDRVGLLGVADRGTLLLDEVTELPLSIQKKLLFLLSERAFKRVGGKNDIKVDVRIISATNKDLEQEIKKGKFREDLFYRLNVIQINIPPLRERKDDIPMLVNHFIKKYNLETGKDIKGISPKALKQLLSYDFPGNIRELENIIEKSVFLETSQTIREVQVSSFRKRMRVPKTIIHPVRMPDEGIDLKKSIQDMEKNLILKALKRTRGSKKATAELLNISLRTLKFKLDRYGLLKTE